MANILTTQAGLEAVRDNKDRSCRLTFETQELTNEEFNALRDIRGEVGWLAFALNPVSEKDLPKENAEVGTKTPSARLRAVLFILWKHEHSLLDFDVFYKAKMEGIINKIKLLLDAD
jgi:hypothetical protein